MTIAEITAAYPTKIVRDTAGNFYCVTELKDESLAHAYLGYPVKHTRAGFAPKGKATPRLVRKFGCTEVAA